MVSPAVLMSAPQPRAQVSAAWSWHSHCEENMVQRREEVVLAGPPTRKAEPHTSMRKWGFGLLGWENPSRQCLFITEAESD